MIMTWMRAHLILGYFSLAFLISWGGILAVFAGHGFDMSPLGTLETGLLLLPILLGPSVSGIVMAEMLDGRARLREIGARLVAWRVPAQWYGVALLTIPLTLLAILLIFWAGPGVQRRLGWFWPCYSCRWSACWNSACCV